MSSLQRKSLIATAAIFCCRFTGLLREVVYTSLFGATGALDAFLTAFRVPNMLRDMFAEGALSWPEPPASTSRICTCAMMPCCT